MAPPMTTTATIANPYLLANPATLRSVVAACSGVRRAALLWLVFFAAYAATAGLPAAGGRDLSEPEAQTLLVAESIVSDGDLDLRDEYGARSWRSFYPRDLAPRARPRDGRPLDPLGLAVPLLVA